MARNKKDLFKNNLSIKPTPQNKPEDRRIEEVANQIDSEEVKGEKGFHLKMGIDDFNKLAQVSKKTHIPKKYIILDALKDYYEKNGYA